MNLENYPNTQISKSTVFFLAFLSKRHPETVSFSGFHYKEDLQGFGQQTIGKLHSTI